jgi:UTP--glucose-1-phosphate uridylyltransferase
MANILAVLLACFFVNLVTLSGVALIGLKATTGSACQSLFALNGFAAGALLGAAAFLMLLESSHLVEAEWGGEENESEVAWRWGAALLAGFLLPLVGQMVSDALGVEDLAQLLNGKNAKVSRQINNVEAEKQTELVGTVGAEEPQEQAVAQSPLNKKSAGDNDHTNVKTAVAAAAAEEEAKNTSNSAVFAVCFGDVFHNFTDGVFIGAAFKLCDSNSAAWAVAGGAAAHEVTPLCVFILSSDNDQRQWRPFVIPPITSTYPILMFVWSSFAILQVAQELADFVVLTSPQVGLSPLRALALNFGTGTSIVLGGLLVTLADVNDGVLGLLLACGAGAYIYLGAVVSLPAALAGASTVENEEEGKDIDKARKSRLRSRRALVLLSFALGAIAIGLVLLNHKHCEDHDHDEHEEDEEHHDEEDEDHHDE